MCETGRTADPPKAQDDGPDDWYISVLFRVSGDTARRADIISIAVSVSRPSSIQAGQQEIQRLVAALFRQIGKTEPAGLIRSMERRRYYLARQPYGVVWFNFVKPDMPVDPSYRRTFWFRLSE